MTFKAQKGHLEEKWLEKKCKRISAHPGSYGKRPGRECSKRAVSPMKYR